MSLSACNLSLQVPAARVHFEPRECQVRHEAINAERLWLPDAAAAVSQYRGDKHGIDHGETCELRVFM